MAAGDAGHLGPSGTGSKAEHPQCDWQSHPAVPTMPAKPCPHMLRATPAVTAPARESPRPPAGVRVDELHVLTTARPLLREEADCDTDTHKSYVGVRARVKGPHVVTPCAIPQATRLGHGACEAILQVVGQFPPCLEGSAGHTSPCRWQVTATAHLHGGRVQPQPGVGRGAQSAGPFRLAAFRLTVPVE